MIERFEKAGLWADTPTEVERLDAHAELRPLQEALVDSRRRLTWAEVRQWTDRVALGLIGLGFARDSIVLAQLPNLAETWLLRFALKKAGIIGLTIPMRFGFRELEHLLKETGAAGLVLAPEYVDAAYWGNLKKIRRGLPLLTHVLTVGRDGPQGTIPLPPMALDPIENRYPADTLKTRMFRLLEVDSLTSTSGSTGLPKAVEYVALPYAMQQAYIDQWKLTPDDVVGALIPLYGGASAVCGRVAPWLGCKVAMLEKYAAEDALRLIQQERVTVANGVPTQIVRMLNHPDFSRFDLSSLRYFVYSAAFCPPEVARKAEETMGCRVLSFYGATEVACLTMTSPQDPPAMRYNSIGQARPGVQIRLVDAAGADVPAGTVGEITGRGACSPSGYFRDPAATRTAWGGELDGWFRTGDLGWVDGQGYYYIAGRKKDMINRGGQNIVPVEIESLICSHPAVAQAAVVPMPDPELGERVCAYVLLRPACRLELAEIVSFLKKTGLAVYKLPERLEIVSEFPEAGGQKIAKQELVRDITRKLAQEAGL